MTSIKQQILSGVFYTAVAKYSGILISLAVTAVLARLLSPKDFGIVAIATVIINFFNIFTNIGFSTAIIQNKELTTKDMDNIYAFTLWLGIAIGGLFFLSSWGIAHYYQSSQLIIICQLLSISLFFSAAAIVPNTLFYRDKKFKFIAYRTSLIQLITGLLAVTAALTGAGLYTLTIQPILSSMLVYIVALKKYPTKFQFTFDIESIKKIWNYSTYQFLFNLVNYFTRNLDKILIGKYMGMNYLGYYEKSYRLMMLPLQNITFVITPVMHPVLSEFQNDLDKLGYINERITRLLAFIGFPLSTLLYFCADELVLIFFGNQWLASIPIFKILSLTVSLQLVLSSSGSFFQAGDDTRGLFICGSFSALICAISILTGIFYFQSMEAVAWGTLFSFCINFIICYATLYYSTFHKKLMYFFSNLLSPLLLGCIVGIALYLLSLYFINLNIFLSLTIKTTLCILTSCTYLQMTKEYDFFLKLKQFIR